MNAEKTPCPILIRPDDPIYDENIREFQGCPTVAVTRGGRIFVGWFSGGIREPHMDNYCLLTFSDDGGKTFGRPYLVIPSSKELLIHAEDIQLWTAPDGTLYVFWVQDDVVPQNEENLRRTDFPCITDYLGHPRIGGFMFTDYTHTVWCMTCENPDAEAPSFSAPRLLDRGFLRNKPLALSEKKWLLFNYDQLNWQYGFNITEDGGKMFSHRYGGKKVDTQFDEAMAYRRADGVIRMLARTKKVGVLAESISYDEGLSWTDGVLTDIPNPNTRFYISRTPTGRLLMIGSHHAGQRTNMTCYLSEDDGRTWCAKNTFDTRADLSYPDADFYDGKIFFVYDRERTKAKEILFGITTEDDILAGKAPDVHIISKP